MTAMSVENRIPQPPPGYYRVDIRVFTALLTIVMTASFFAGFILVPPFIENWSMLSQIVSSHTSTPHQAHSPAGDGKTESTDDIGSDRKFVKDGSVTMLNDVENAKVVRDAFLVNASERLAKSEQARRNAEAASINPDSELHLPAGQHLLVDFKGVESAFLNSEERLSKAMVDTIDEAGLTMLSYHCHALMPAGVSCVGVLLESHMSFHTWPDEGVITLDLFTCGSKPLIPVIPTIERLFGIGENSKAQWSHELRGFRGEEEKKRNYLADSSDLSLWVLSPLEMHSKTLIYSDETEFQKVDIWDIVEVTDYPTYEDVLKHNMTPGDPRLRDPSYASPDRLLFLDGTIQSIQSTEKIYHEAMVHPAMFAHPGPKQVAILGGGEGATLREVLKHKTVEKATMIEIDEELVEISRKYLPGFSDCSDLVGRAANCFDDERASVQFADGRQWFIDRYGPHATDRSSQQLFDVILVDALDPEDESIISDMLYSDESFISSLVSSLSDEGVLAIQVGTAATIDDPRAEFGIYKNREKLFKMLENNEEVRAMLVYEEPHCGFLEPHAFLIICKSVECRSRWYGRSDQIDYEIYDRIVRTHSKDRALTFFDGTTQRSYQWPKRGWETVYCRREPMPFECAYRTLDRKAEMHEMDLDDESKNSFRVEKFTDADGKVNAAVFAKVKIPKGSYVMAEHLASSLMVTTRNLEGLQKNVQVGGGRVAIIEDLLEFFETYAHESRMDGSKQHYVEVGGTVLIRRVNNKDDANIALWVPPHPSGKNPKYSPVYERHRMSFDLFMVASRDIAEGEEILMYKE